MCVRDGGRALVLWDGDGDCGTTSGTLVENGIQRSNGDASIGQNVDIWPCGGGSGALYG